MVRGARRWPHQYSYLPGEHSGVTITFLPCTVYMRDTLGQIWRISMFVPCFAMAPVMRRLLIEIPGSRAQIPYNPGHWARWVPYLKICISNVRPPPGVSDSPDMSLGTRIGKMTTPSLMHERNFGSRTLRIFTPGSACIVHAEGCFHSDPGHQHNSAPLRGVYGGLSQTDAGTPTVIKVLP